MANSWRHGRHNFAAGLWNLGCPARDGTRSTGVISLVFALPPFTPVSPSLPHSRSLSEVPLGQPAERTGVGGVKAAGTGAGLSCHQPHVLEAGEWAGPVARDSQWAFNPPGAACRRAGALPETLRLGVPPQELHEGHCSSPPTHPSIHPFIFRPSVHPSRCARFPAAPAAQRHEPDRARSAVQLRLRRR